MKTLAKKQSKKSKPWFVYVLLCRDGTLYTGITNNLEKRLQKHRSGTGAKYTRSRGAKEILYSQKFSNRSNATKREAQIKKMKRSEKLKIISASNSASKKR